MQWGKTAYFACLEAPSSLVIEFGKDKVPAYEGNRKGQRSVTYVTYVLNNKSLPCCLSVEVM